MESEYSSFSSLSAAPPGMKLLNCNVKSPPSSPRIVFVAPSSSLWPEGGGGFTRVAALTDAPASIVETSSFTFSRRYNDRVVCNMSRETALELASARSKTFLLRMFYPWLTSYDRMWTGSNVLGYVKASELSNSVAKERNFNRESAGTSVRQAYEVGESPGRHPRRRR